MTHRIRQAAVAGIRHIAIPILVPDRPIRPRVRRTTPVAPRPPRKPLRDRRQGPPVPGPAGIRDGGVVGAVKLEHGERRAGGMALVVVEMGVGVEGAGDGGEGGEGGAVGWGAG